MKTPNLPFKNTDSRLVTQDIHMTLYYTGSQQGWCTINQKKRPLFITCLHIIIRIQIQMNALRIKSFLQVAILMTKYTHPVYSHMDY